MWNYPGILSNDRYIWDAHFEGRGGHEASSIIPLERVMLVSYTLSIVTIVRSLTIHPQFAIVCDAQFNGVGHFG